MDLLRFRHQLRMRLLQINQLAHKPIKFLIANLRLAQNEILVIMMLKLRAKLLNSTLNIRRHTAIIA